MLLAFAALEVLVGTTVVSAIIVGLFVIVARLTPAEFEEDDVDDVPQKNGPAHCGDVNGPDRKLPPLERDWIDDDGRLDDTLEIDVTETPDSPEEA